MADVVVDEKVAEEEVVVVVPPVVVIPPEDEKTDTTDSENKEVETKEEAKKVDEPEKEKVSDDLAGLQATIAQLQIDLATAKANGESTVALDQANELIKVKNGLVTDYEGILTGIIEGKLKDVPENFKELVPVNLTLKEQLDWITKAEKSGIFKQGNPNIEIGKPLNPNNKQTVDTTKLSASSIMALAYGNSVGKGKK